MVVPGLGAFIAHYEGASLSAEEGYITPPRREVGLNPSLTHNDGLLAGSVARREGVSFEAAMGLIAGEVAKLRAQLDRDGHFPIDGVGTLYKPAQEGQTPVFVPQADGFFNGAYNLLQPVRLPEPSVAADVDGAQKVATGRIFAPWLRVAASVAVAVTLGVGLFTGTADLATSHTDTASVIPTRQIMSVSHGQQSNLEEVEPAPEKAALQFKIVEPKDSLASVTLPGRVLDIPANTKRFYVVVASLSTMGKAKSYIAARNGHKFMGIVRAGKGRYRICMAVSSTFEGALAHQRSISAFYPDSWIAWDE